MWGNGHVSSCMDTGASRQIVFLYLPECGQFTIAMCVSVWIILTLIVTYQRILNRRDGYVQ